MSLCTFICSKIPVIARLVRTRAVTIRVPALVLAWRDRGNLRVRRAAA